MLRYAWQHKLCLSNINQQVSAGISDSRRRSTCVQLGRSLWPLSEMQVNFKVSSETAYLAYDNKPTKNYGPIHTYILCTYIRMYVHTSIYLYVCIGRVPLIGKGAGCKPVGRLTTARSSRAPVNYLRLLLDWRFFHCHGSQCLTNGVMVAQLFLVESRLRSTRSWSVSGL